MAEETLDAAVAAHRLGGGPSKTVGLVLEGGQDWSPTLYIRLVQDYGLENEVGTDPSHRHSVFSHHFGYIILP